MHVNACVRADYISMLMSVKLRHAVLDAFILFSTPQREVHTILLWSLAYVCLTADLSSWGRAFYRQSY